MKNSKIFVTNSFQVLKNKFSKKIYFFKKIMFLNIDVLMDRFGNPKRKSPSKIDNFDRANSSPIIKLLDESKYALRSSST